MRRAPTTFQISWFLDANRMKQLNLTPSYQRKSVWTLKDRRYFLDTIFRDYPTPPVFLHREINDSGVTTYHVVDGKQRLETILSFANDRISIDKNFGDSRLNGKKFSELDSEHRRKFWDYTLIVDFIEVVDGILIQDVFDRVNRNSKNLEPQELRHARFSGWFITKVEEESDRDFWWKTKIYTRGKDKRMKNDQLMSELYLLTIEKTIVGFDQDYLNEKYAEFDSIDDEQSEFDETEFINNRDHTVLILIQMEDFNGVISSYAKTANNIYSLWAYLTLNEVSDIRLFCERYTEFMHSVERLSSQESGQSVQLTLSQNPEQQERIDLLVAKYLLNSKGAATEFFQRSERYEAMKEYFELVSQ